MIIIIKKKDKFDLDKYNNNSKFKSLNIEQDFKDLHSLYIMYLFKDRIAPTIPFDPKLIIASSNLLDNKEISEFLK